MANILSAEQQARARIFDRLVESAEEVAQGVPLEAFDPAIRADIPALSDINREAFLADVKHGVASVPEGKLSSSGVAVIPLLHHGEVIRASASLMQPTPRRLDESVDRFDIKRETIVRKLGRLLEYKYPDPSQHTFDMAEQARMSTSSRLLFATISRGLVPFPKIPFNTVLRSVVALSAHVDHTPREVVGASAMHEYMHVQDCQNNWRTQSHGELWAEKNKNALRKMPRSVVETAKQAAAERGLLNDIAAYELRGYHVSFVLQAYHGVAPSVPEAAAAYKIEQMRRELTHADEPFTPSLEVVRRLRRVGAIVL